jgi:3-oxoacyl-[acyl-carrier protein] reductase
LAVLRYATTVEVAGFVAFVASPGSSFFTGAGLHIDGGYAA